MGAIVLAITGAEALYVDIGHFGRRPIQLAWTGLVLPGLALNDLGQSALLLADLTAIEPPFCRLVPDALVLPAVLHNMKHNQVLHARNLIVTVKFEPLPCVPVAERVAPRALAPGFCPATLHFGLMKTPDVPAALALADAQGVPVPLFETRNFLRRETVVPSPGGGMAAWREKLFAAMSRNAGGVVDLSGLPGCAVVELGTRAAL